MIDAEIALAMHVEGDLSIGEIATEMGVDPSVVRDEILRLRTPATPPETVADHWPEPPADGRWRPWTPWPSKCNPAAVEPHRYRLDEDVLA